MKDYLEKGIVIPQNPCFILVDRKTSHSESRKGIIIAVDLEEYDYNKGSQTLIRATEGTVIERLPPRIKIRENASLELPHVLLLIDDPSKTVIEPLSAKIDTLEKVYDFELMMNGGHIKGYKICSDKDIASITSALSVLANPDGFSSKYGVSDDKGVLLFAVGDGNHSLASAKGHWENIKKSLSVEEIEKHPARFALAEIVNIHDEGITFEPIHRVVFNTNYTDLLDNMVSYYGTGNCSYKIVSSKEEMDRNLELLRKTKGAHSIGFNTFENYGIVTINNPKHNLEVGSLQCFLDEYLTDETVKIDYIHGEDVVTKLGSKENNIGFYLPPMSKHDLFKTVILDGVLPRKTFSMGEAEEKRFYLECRKIVMD
jgi:uncharacterized protein (DUF1015 family)